MGTSRRLATKLLPSLGGRNELATEPGSACLCPPLVSYAVQMDADGESVAESDRLTVAVMRCRASLTRMVDACREDRAASAATDELFLASVVNAMSRHPKAALAEHLAVAVEALADEYLAGPVDVEAVER